MRMLAFTADLACAGRRSGLQVAQLRYRTRGYNDGEAVDDVRWALDRLWEEHGVPAYLVGHSMGGRAALRAADHPAVSRVIALAPWLPEGEPVDQLAGRNVMIAHGDRDRVTSAHLSADYAQRARASARSLEYLQVRRGGHAMLRRARLWQRIVREFCLGHLAVSTPEVST